MSQINVSNITSLEERVFLLHYIQDRGYMCYKNPNTPNTIDVYVPIDAKDELSDFDFFYDQVAYEQLNEFHYLDKNRRGELFVQWRQELEPGVYQVLYEDFTKGFRPGNSSCDGADPFCTGNGNYQFPAGVNSGSPCGNYTSAPCGNPYYCSGYTHQGEDNCLYTAPNPAFYYLRIDQPGNLDILMQSSGGQDIDFDCWGPFNNLDDACDLLSCYNMVDCSYSIYGTEHCNINNAQTGQYYILLITNYSNQQCNITFSNVGTGSTDCSILPPLVDNDGPYCAGQTIHLTGNAQSGATYQWTGPNGFSSNLQNPTIYNCTTANAGTYICTISLNGQTSFATTTVVIYPNPVANFTNNTVCVGQTTQFTSTSYTNPSGGQITDYSWNFGDGSYGTGQNTTHTYSQAGTYYVTLTVSTGNGQCTDQITLPVTVNALPTPSFTASTVCQGTATQFSSTASGQSYQWNFGDGQTGTGQNTYHTYSQAGSYLVTLTVTSSAGCSNQVSQYVTVNPLPVANFNATTVCQGHATQFTSTSTGQQITSFQWNFGDGQTGSGQNISHTYASSGTYQVTLTVQTSSGCSGQITQTVTVSPTLEGHDYRTICSTQFPHTWQGSTFYQAGTQDILLSSSVTGCDSIVHLHLSVYPANPGDDYLTICQTQLPYTWQGATFQQAGTQDIHLTSTVTGCDSVVHLHLSVNPTLHGDDYVSVCPNQLPYLWQGATFQQAGTMDIHLTSSAGCDSIVTLHLSVNPETHNAETVTSCGSYVWHGTTYSTSGTYTYSYYNANGCPSVDTLHLTINTYSETTQTVTACDSYTWVDGVTYTASTTTPIHHFLSQQGCDSIVHLNLTVNYSGTDDVYETACDSYTWTTGNGATYTQSGNYVWNTTTAAGCPQVVTLHLTVNSSTHNVVSESTCGSYTWHGQTYTSSGTYIYSYQNSNGCPSADTLHLTIQPGTHNVVNQATCGSYTWHGQTYTSSGTYIYYYNNNSGCASADTLHLTIYPETHNVENVTVCGSYTWHGQTYTTSGNYVYHYNNSNGCPSADTLHLTINSGSHNTQWVEECLYYTWHGQTYTSSGTYIYAYNDSNGCPSQDTLQLTILPGTHHSYHVEECLSYTWHGQNYTTSGTYTYSYLDIDDCPSMDTLHLTILPGTHNTQWVEECLSYTWHDSTYTSSGTYTYSYLDIDDCPSEDILYLTILPGTHNTYNAEECLSYTWHGHTYTSSGTYTYSYFDIDDCPSVDVLNLTILPGTHNSYYVEECQSYTWHGQNYTTSGTYTYGYEDIDDCESTDTLHLIINPILTYSDAITICANEFPYTFHGHVFNAAGTQTGTVPSTVTGCDSTWTLTVSASPLLTASHSMSVCANDFPYTWQA